MLHFIVLLVLGACGVKNLPNETTSTVNKPTEEAAPPQTGPVQEGAREPVRVSLRGKDGCVARGDGTVGCWRGSRDDGIGDIVNVPVLSEIIDVSVPGGGVAAALRRDGRLMTWKLPTEQGAPPSPAEEVMGPAPPIVDTYDLCAINGAGELWCGGRSMTSLYRQPLFSGIVRGDFGGDMDCGVGTDGGVRCSGNRLASRAEDFKDELDVTVPPGDIIDVAGGVVMLFFLHQDGTVSSHPGKEGGGLKEVSGVQGGVQLENHEAFTCALREEGRVSCWWVLYGGYTSWVGPVFDVPGVEGAKDITVDNGNICAIVDGSVRCFSCLASSGPSGPSEPCTPWPQGGG